MILSTFTMNLRGPWMITPDQAAAMAPILQGVINGYITEIEKGPAAAKISCADLIPAPQGKANPYASKSIYVTYLTGTMLKYDSCGEPGTRSIGEGLKAADAEPDVIGHIIVADSGGGSSDSVPELADAIKACTKPVVGFIDGTAASACIYALSYCDRIIAHQPKDRVGCIGTLIQLSGYPKFHKDSDGYVSARIYADAATEKNADYEAALEGNFQVIREQTLNPLNEQFTSDIRANRPNVREDQLTGRTYFAEDAVGTLIDAIGPMADAAQAVADLAAAQLDQNSSTMETQNNNYPNLMALPGLAELAVDQSDGTVTLQGVQLQAVETALAEAARLREANATLTAERDAARETIAQRDARITELENSYQAAVERAENPAPEQPAPSGTPENEGGLKPAEDFDEALASCQEFLNR